MAIALASCSGDQSVNDGEAQDDLTPEPIQAPPPIQLEDAEDSGEIADAPVATDDLANDTGFEAESPAPPPIPAIDPSPGRTSIGPTYSCDGQLTNVERMVCDDSGLAGLEREMVARYNARRDASPASERDRHLADQRRFLRQLRACQTRACISAAYRQRIGELL
ncbi:lysozyme inhibitor LprI family protein [Parasphingopyxis sp.]|uniref:lysozyme inhibitor LprI family protein n=1 Tax=Parasphingopyxis sp. TaxID=1920299 RepID=UPI003FA0BFA5